jgi:hypothetical protein
MEKSTKIFLGLAAAGVVAYLVFKPKKAVAQSKDIPYDACAKDPKSYECAVQQGGGGIIPRGIPELEKINNYFKSQVAPTNGKCPNGYYQEMIECIKAPCPQGMCVPYPELT